MDYGLAFLKEKGFFKSIKEAKDKYRDEDREIKGEITYYFDPENRIAYFVDFNQQHIEIIIRSLKIKRNFDYYWFWNGERLLVFRTYGENKLFIYNTTYSKRPDYVKSKENKLSKFSSTNPAALFEVKDVITRFYRRLWDLRLKLAKTIEGDFYDRDKILAAQRLLDRLIFTYFLAEKGIIWGKDKRGKSQQVSARKLFSHLLDKSDDFHIVLNDIFFDYLNSPDKNDMPVTGSGDTSLNIPYLNGGLFREREIETISGDKIKESKIKFEGFEWSELVEEMNSYNWIIGDYISTEDEETIGNLTPEILGHIYEKFVITVSELDEIDVEELDTTKEGELKKGNKKIGAYYTPEIITNYIAENTIFPFAMDKLGFDDKYENFNAFYEDHRKDSETLFRFNDVLREIKILDPAVGSGAFLMAAADLLFEWRQKCGETLDDYTLRRDIIINNLHGVDIMGGAVEICMLRLWLWLIAAADPEKKIDALPNIDFNIFEGNSLIGYTDTHQVADIRMKKRKGKKVWKTLTDQYYSLDNYYEDSIRNLFLKRNKMVEEYKEARGNKAENLLKEIRGITKEFNDILNSKLLSELQAKGIDIDEEGLGELKPFHWVMEFSDVFENGGFDVVVGNPPYVRSIRLKESNPVAWNIYKKEYYSASFREYDIYLPVLESSSILLSKSGRLGFIMPNKWLHAQMGLKAREFFLEKRTISEIMNFKSLQIFQGITNYTILLFLNNAGNDSFFVRQYGGDPGEKIERVMSDLKSPEWESGWIKHRNLTPDPWTFSLGKSGMLLDKLKGMPNKFGEYYKVYQGTGTRADAIFFVKKFLEEKNTFTIYSKHTGREHVIEKDIAKPSLKGMHISNYSITERDNLLIFPYKGKELIPEKEMKDKYPLTWEYLNQKECRTKLEKREKGRFKGPNFYCYGRPQNHELIPNKKIIIPAIVNFAEAAYDDVGYHVIDSVYGIRKIAEPNLDDHFILAILNCRLLTFFLMETGTNLRGGYFTMKSAYLEPFPLPDLKSLDRSSGSLYSRVIHHAKEIMTLLEDTVDENVQHIQELDDEINHALFSIYGLNDEEAELVLNETEDRCFKNVLRRE